jgi:DNA modification methylase
MSHSPVYQLIRADCGRGIPLADGSIHAVVTSPPYYALRSYAGVAPTDWPEISYAPLPGLPPVVVPAMTCCLGAEPDPAAFVGHLVKVFDNVKRVLHKSGVAWVNLGDSYNSAASNQNGCGLDGAIRGGNRQMGRNTRTVSALESKQLFGVPWRFALAMQARGWYLRSAPPWVKPGNAMPEPVADRPTTAHESLFMFTKSSNYHFDMESVRRKTLTEPHARQGRNNPDVSDGPLKRSRVDGRSASQYAPEDQDRVWGSENGRSLRTADLFLESLDDLIAWHRDRIDHLTRTRQSGGLVASDADDPAAVLVNPEAFRGSHYAVMPRRLAEILVRCSTSERGVCQCGAPWERVVELGEKVASGPNKLAHKPRSGSGSNHLCRQDAPPDEYGDLPRYQRTFLGWRPTCSCPPGPTRPAVVLDPFVGSGTTLVAANALERDALGLDASADYLRMAARRLDRPHARPLAEPADDGPGPLFSGGES